MKTPITAAWRQLTRSRIPVSTTSCCEFRRPASFAPTHIEIASPTASRATSTHPYSQGVDSLIFYPLAFLGAAGWTNELVFKVLVTQWVLKVSWEVLLTPFTYIVVNFLKRREGIDVFDDGTDFTPFKAQV